MTMSAETEVLELTPFLCVKHACNKVPVTVPKITRQTRNVHIHIMHAHAWACKVPPGAG